MWSTRCFLPSGSPASAMRPSPSTSVLNTLAAFQSCRMSQQGHSVPATCGIPRGGCGVRRRASASGVARPERSSRRSHSIPKMYARSAGPYIQPTRRAGTASKPRRASVATAPTILCAMRSGRALKIASGLSSIWGRAASLGAERVGSESPRLPLLRLGPSLRPRFAQARIRLLELAAPEHPHRPGERPRGVPYLFLKIDIPVEVVVAGSVRPVVADIPAKSPATVTPPVRPYNALRSLENS
jgi:hypothetical protein